MATTTSLTSVGSNRSGRTKRQYLVKKPADSCVDESLFGPPARLQMMSGNRSWTASTEHDMFSSKTSGKQSQKHQQPGVVEVITKDLIRTLKLPSTPDPSGISIIIDKGEYSRLKSRAKVLTITEQQELEKLQKEEKMKRMENSNSRKKLMQNFEDQRKKNEKPSDLEEDAARLGAEVTARAKEQMEQQDDEIKKLNELILNAKCHAIRDTQLNEKEEIKAFMMEEEKRLDTIMEVERLRDLQEYEERERKRHIERLKGAQVIHKQIEEREIQRQLDKEKKDQETQQLLKYMERLQEEDWENLQKKREAQHSLMEEVTKCNEEIQRLKMQEREQAKLEDLKVMEYLKEKEAREEQLQKELEEQKIEKEREVARLRAQQERAKDKEAERDTLRAKRNQEKFEREWRRKEKEEAQKKAENENQLRIDRENQVRNKEHFLAVQAQREKLEFERVLKEQRDQMTKDEQSQYDAALRRKKHADEVRTQVKEREDEFRTARRKFFEEGIKLDQEAKERRRKLDEIKQRKLAELRDAGIPEKYCAEVSRRITAPPPSFITQ